MNLPRIPRRTSLPLFLVAGASLLVGTGARPSPSGGEDTLTLEEARIFFEYNQSDNDLGVHVFLDGEDWKQLEIEDPLGRTLFAVKGRRGFAQFGMTELFFEGAEPSLAEVPLQVLLDKFPEGDYEFEGRTVDGEDIEGEATFSHAVPDGPAVSTQVGPDDFLQISWTPVTGSAPGFPVRPIEIAGYQVIVGSFEVTLPATATSVTVPPEYVGSLGPGPHGFEVLAIEVGHNQTITAGTFTL